jgi:hypothetical protein
VLREYEAKHPIKLFIQWFWKWAEQLISPLVTALAIDTTSRTETSEVIKHTSQVLELDKLICAAKFIE